MNSKPPGPRRCDTRQPLELVGCSHSQETGVEQVPNPGTSLGLVHVVRGDEQRDSLGRKLEEQVPEVTASHRVDAGCRLVKEDQVGPVQQGAGQRQPLLPAT